MSEATRLLTVVSGGPDTGKSLIAELLVREKRCVMVARDSVRAALGVPVDEGLLSHVLVNMARTFLVSGMDVCTVSWNLDPSDRVRWLSLAEETGARCRWIHVDMPR